MDNNMEMVLKWKIISMLSRKVAYGNTNPELEHNISCKSGVPKDMETGKFKENAKFP